MLERGDLPIPVSDPVWDLIMEVQAIAPLQLITRRRDKAPSNRDAESSFDPKIFEIGIGLYDNITEALIAHEVLHAWLRVKGYPRFSVINKRGLGNFENLIQHYYIFEKLKEMGFDPIPQAQEDWEEGVVIMRGLENSYRKLKTRDLILRGTLAALDGLMAELDFEKVRGDIITAFRPGVDSAVKVYQELTEADLTDIQEHFELYRSIASILDLTSADAVIKKNDFEARTTYTYDILSGEEITQ